MTTYEIVAGDGGSAVSVTITDSVTGDPVDLTGKTAQLRYTVNGGATVTKSMTVLNQATNPGQATYQFLTTDLTTSGELRGEVRLQAGQPDQLTTVDDFYIAVKAALP